MRRVFATACVLVLALAACGDDGDSSESGSPDETADSGEVPPAETSDIDECALLTDAEITSIIGATPPSEPTEPAGPFTGCSWGVGTVSVQIAPADALILAPGEAEDCPSAGLGDDSRSCPGSVKVLTNGIHVSVSTISNVTNEQLEQVAAIVVPKLSQ